MIAVIDTNVIVSGFWSKDSKPHTIINQIISNTIQVAYDQRIIDEYQEVLCREKFKFDIELVEDFLVSLIGGGLSVVPLPILNVKLPDEDDRPFYEVAKFMNCPLITGNSRHYPKDDLIVTVSEFCDILNNK